MKTKNQIRNIGALRHIFLLSVIASALMTLVCAGCGGSSGGAGSNQPPTASFTATPMTGNAPLVVAFNASASGDSDGTIVDYAWNFGDDSAGTGVTIAHTFTTAGSYTVTLTVADDDGATNSTTENISVTTATTTHTVSGTILASANAAMDSDVNDPNAPYTSNDTPQDAQAIPNPVTVGGYVNVAGTGEGGRSWNVGDLSDYFTVTLAQDQTIALHIAEFSTADLDLYLYGDTGQLIDSSVGTGTTESLTIPSGGAYVVEVYAYALASNYNLTIGQSAASATPLDLRLSDEFVPGEVIARFKDNVLPASGKDTIAARAAAVGMNAKAGAPGRAMLLSFDDEEGKQQAFKTLGIAPSDRDMKIYQGADPRTQRKLDTLRIIKALRSRPDILSADPNYIQRASKVPNDEFYSFQWHYPLINLPQAWDVTTSDSNVIVAVIDTGVLLSHPDLQGQLIAGYDFISDPAISVDGDGIDNDPDDPGDDSQNGSTFHGTHVAGTVAAATNGTTGVAGVAWSTRIMPLRVLGKGGGTTYDIMQAVLYAAGLENDSGSTPDHPADVMNLSLGSGSGSQAAQDVYTQALNEGVIVIAAAGNNSSSSLFYPASYDGVVSVSAVDMNSDLAPYSNFGTAIDVAAPGGDTSKDVNGDGYADGVLSTCGDDTTGYIQLVYRFFQGTSMASPHMAGVVALMKAVYPALTPDQLDSLLASGNITGDLGDSGRDDLFGHGLIDAYKAVIAAQDLAGGGGTLPATLVLNPSSLNFGGTLTDAVLSVQNGGGGTLTISGVTDDADWLTVSATDVDTNGLGHYTAMVNRAGLADGTHTATITFTSSENTVLVAVIMQVGGDAGTGDAGYHYVLLIDPDTFETIHQVEVEVSNGRYAYSFTDVSSGIYEIYAGTDSDNDFFVGEAGEATGAFMSLDQPVSISVVNTDLTGLDFSTAFGVNWPTQSAGGEPVRGPWLRRIDVKGILLR